MPLQHAHPETLRRMRRPPDTDRVRLIADLRAAMPDIALRTSLIVGYPGETEAEFAALLEFLEERLSTEWARSSIPGAGHPRRDLPDQVPEEVKEERYQRLMAAQQAISLKRNHAQVGRTLDVLVEGTGKGLAWAALTGDAPEIDGLVIFKGEARVGQFARVRITRAEEYDLSGTWVERKAAPSSNGTRIHE